MAQDAISRGKTHLVSSSGGNAGLALAYSALVLGVSCTVFVPSTIQEAVKQRLITLGANVVPAGNVWDEADKEARRYVDSDPQRYVS